MSEENKDQPATPAPSSSPESPPSEPVRLVEPPTPDAIIGSGALEKRASVFPVAQAETTPIDALLTGPGPVTGTPVPAEPANPAASTAPTASTEAPPASDSGE